MVASRASEQSNRSMGERMTDEELNEIENRRQHGGHLAGCIDCRNDDAARAALVREVRRLAAENERLREQRARLNNAIRHWGQTGETSHLTEAVEPEES